MKYIYIVALICIFLFFLYTGLRAYTKSNFGKSKEEMGTVNGYIYGSIIYMAIITVFMSLMFYKFL